MGEADQILPVQRCHACRELKDRMDFSKSQRKMRNGRRCSSCVHSGVWELPKGQKKLRRGMAKGTANKGKTKMRPRMTMGGR